MSHRRRLRAIYGEGGGAEYEGPLDIVPGAVVAYGQRALSAAKLGTALYTIRRDTDDTEQSFSSDAVTGDAPVSSISSFIGSDFTHVGAVTDTMDTIVLTSGFTDVAVGQVITGADIPANTTVISVAGLPTIQISQAATGTNAAETLTFTPDGLVTTWVDQSLNSFNATQVVTSNQLRWLANQAGTKPGLTGSAGDFVATETVIVLGEAAPTTLFYVLNTTGVTDAFASTISGDYFAITVTSITGSVEVQNDPDFSGSDFNGSDFTGLHLFELVIDGSGNKTLLIDGVANALSGDPALAIAGDTYNLSIDVTGRGFELILWNATVSAGNRLAIRQNIATYYGITLS